MIKAFDQNFDKGVAADRERDIANGRESRSEAEILKEKESRREIFLENLGFKEGVDVVEVAPKNQDFYNFFVDSEKLSAKKSAWIIHMGTNQRYRH